MRTVDSNAASPRHLHWQAAFNTAPYRTLSPVIWQHSFVSQSSMTNWSGGKDLLVKWVADNSPQGTERRATSPGHRFSSGFSLFATSDRN